MKNPRRAGRHDQNQQNERAGEGGERGRTGGGPGNANDPFMLVSPSVLALEVQQQGNLAWGSRRGAAAAVRKERGDLEGGGSSSEETKGRSGRRRVQEWTWRSGLGRRRGTWRLEEQHREEEEAPVAEQSNSR